VLFVRKMGLDSFLTAKGMRKLRKSYKFHKYENLWNSTEEIAMDTMKE
jgi:hypothetical protein